MYFPRSTSHSSVVSSSTQSHSSRFDLEALDLATSTLVRPRQFSHLGFAAGRSPFIPEILHFPEVIPSFSCLKDKAYNLPSSVFGVVRKYLVGFFKKTDVVIALSCHQNPEYLDMERQNINLPALKQQIQRFVHSIHEIPNLNEPKKAELERLSLNVIGNIERLSDGGGMSVLKHVMFSFASIGLCILPLLTSHKNKDYQYFSLLIAGYAKTMFMLLGLLRNQTSDVGSFLLHFKERHIPYLVPSIPYAFSAYNRHVRQFEAQHVWPFVALSSVFTGTIFLASSAPQLFYKPVVRLFNKAKRLFGQAESPVAHQLSEDVSREVKALFQSVQTEMNSFYQRKDAFEGEGKGLSDVLSTQTIDIQKSCQHLEKAVNDLFAEQAETPAASLNPDFKQKLAFAVLAATLCLGSAATYYDEPMGLVDLGTDAALTVGEMLKTTFSSAETTQRAAEKFSSYSGLAPFLLLFGVLNKIKATHFTDSIAGLTTGIVLLTGANLFLPRPASEALTAALLDCFKSGA